MMRGLTWFCMLAAFAGWLAGGAGAAESYPLLTGEVMTGDPIHFEARGVVLKLSDGQFAPRVPWTNFTQEALKRFAANPKARAFVEPLIEMDFDEPAARAAKREDPIKVTPPQIDRPPRESGLGALFASPLSLAVLLLVYAANVFAAYEIALFRGHDWRLVCGVAAIVPVLAPAAFIAWTGRARAGQAAADEAPPAEEPAPVTVTAEETAAAEHASGHANAPTAPAAAKPPPATVYRRGQTMFNRRFFETKLASFLRLVPSDAEKDLVVEIKSSRGDYVGNRITRILQNELVLQVTKAGASSDVMIPFTEIQEVIVRHKDA